MPSFCIVCGVPFNGRGSHCAHHNPYFNTYLDTSRSNDISHHTDTSTRYLYRARKPQRVGFHGGHEALVPYHSYEPSNSLALAGFDPQPSHRHEGCGHRHGFDPVLLNLKPLQFVFERLSSTHAVTQLTYAVDVHGTRSITATANPEREQCTNCEGSFANYHRLEGHYQDRPIQCDIHGVCLQCE